MNEKTQCIADYLRQSLDLTELCGHCGISRKTGYKWVARCLEEGRPLKLGRLMGVPDFSDFLPDFPISAVGKGAACNQIKTGSAGDRTPDN